MMNKILLFAFAAIAAYAPLKAQTTTPSPDMARLLGRWEVTAYSEQGVQVDKKQAARSQAVTVYSHVSDLRARIWYGYNEYDEQSRREQRHFERWAVRDSLQELERVTEAIAMPYFVVFFADSTLSMYNKENNTNYVRFPEVRRYVFSPATMSIDIIPALSGSYTYENRSQVQILSLTDTTMRLYIPEEAEVVTLVKTAFSVP